MFKSWLVVANRDDQLHKYKKWGRRNIPFSYDGQRFFALTGTMNSANTTNTILPHVFGQLLGFESSKVIQPDRYDHYFQSWDVQHPGMYLRCCANIKTIQNIAGAWPETRSLQILQTSLFILIKCIIYVGTHLNLYG